MWFVDASRVHRTTFIHCRRGAGVARLSMGNDTAFECGWIYSLVQQYSPVICKKCTAESPTPLPRSSHELIQRTSWRDCKTPPGLSRKRQTIMVQTTFMFPNTAVPISAVTTSLPPTITSTIGDVWILAETAY